MSQAKKRTSPFRLQLEALEDRVTPAVNWAALGTGLTNDLNALSQGAHGVVAQPWGELPVLGRQVSNLAGQADQAFTDIAGALNTVFQNFQNQQNQGQTITENAVSNALKNSSVIRDLNGDGKVNASDVQVHINAATGDVDITVHLGKQVTPTVGSNVNIQLGLPGVPLQISGGSKFTASVDVDYNQLMFGLHNGTFYATSPNGKSLLSATVSADAAGTLTGTIGFLRMTATPVQGQKNAAHVEEKVSFDANGLLLSNAQLTGLATVNMTIDAGFTAGGDGGPGLPHIATDFAMNWNLNGSPNGSLASLGSAPTVAFNNVRLGLGTYLGDQLEPIINAVQKITLPLKPIYDAFQARIPGLSDLGEAIPGVGTITLDKLAQLTVALGVLPPDYQLLAEIGINLHQVVELIDSVKLSTNSKNEPMVPVGSFSLGGNGDLRTGRLTSGQTFGDFLQSIRDGNDIPVGALTALVPLAQSGIESVQTKINEFLPQLPGAAQDAIGQAFTTINQKLARLQNNIGLSFPFLDDPENGVFRLLLGQDVDFARFDATVNLPGITESRTLDVWGPVKATFSGSLDLSLNLHLGVDTYGLRQFFMSIVRNQTDPSLLDDGFYIDTSHPLVEIKDGSITADAAAEIVFGEGLEFVARPHLSGSLSSNDLKVSFANAHPADPKLRVFRAGEVGSSLLEVQGSVDYEFKFAVDLGVRVGISTPFGDITIVDGVKEVYSDDIGHGTLISFDDLDTSNPFNVPDQPKPQIDVVFDTNFETGANDGAKDTVVARVAGGNLQLYFNGVLRQPNIYPLSRVKSLTIIASSDDSDITVMGTVLLPVTVDGGSGIDTLTFDDQAYKGKPVPIYAVAADEVFRGVASNLSSIPVLIGTSINYSDVEHLNVRSSSQAATVDVLSLSIPTTIFGGAGTNNYYVGGVGHSIASLGNNLTIIGASNVLGATGTDTLYIDDRVADRYVNYEVDFDHLIRSTDVHIVSQYLLTVDAVYQDSRQQLNYANIESIALAGAGNGNSFSVDTVNHSPFTLRGDLFALSLYSGAGNDDVNVVATSSTLTIHGESGLDSVTLGDSHNGTLGLADAVYLDNASGLTNLILDDRADTQSRSVSVDTTAKPGGAGAQLGVIRGLIPVPPGSSIFTIAPAIEYDAIGIANVDILGGSGGNTYSVFDTVQNLLTAHGHTFDFASTNIHAGSGDDIINVLGTTGRAEVDGEGGSNQISIGGPPDGLGNLTTIRGNVSLLGGAQPGTSVTINDGRAFLARTSKYQYTMDSLGLVRTSLSGLSPTGFIDYSGLTAGNVIVQGANGGNTFVINGTPTITPDGELDVFTGGGNDTVSVFGTNAPLNIDLGTGTSQSIQFGDAAHPLDAITAPITVRGAGTVSAVVSNAAATASQLATVGVVAEGTVQQVQRLQLTPAGYVTLNTFDFILSDPSKLEYRAGTIGDNISVTGTLANLPLTLTGGAGADAFVIFADEAPLLSPITVVGQASNNDYSVYYDYRNTSAQTYNFSAPAGTTETELVTRSGAAPVTYQNMKEIVLYTPYTGNGSVANVLSSPADLFLNMAFDAKDTANLGSKAPGTGGTVANIRGAVSVAGFNGLTVNVDDSGNKDKTPKTVTFESQLGQYDYGNHIVGLLPNILDWRMNNTGTMNIHGGAADETYVLDSSTLEPSIRIDGGGGTNTLDYSAVPGAAGLVSFYDANGTANDSVGGHYGILDNGTTFTPGHDGQAFQFDGVDDDVRVANSPSLEPQNVTVEMWVKGDGPSGYLLAKGANNLVAASYGLYSLHGGLRFYVADASGHFVESPDAGNGVWDGQWHHVAGTYDGSTVRLYVDGVEVGSGTATTLTIGYNLPTSNDLTIGSYNGSILFAGAIDDVGIYNRALSAAEIRAHASGEFNAGIGVTVNLLTGTATGLRGGIANIQTVVGSSADDILVGTGGSTLSGGAGRDILIAGSKPAALFGGDGEDLLIGGTTIYDQDPAGLEALRASWSRRDVDYATRATDLRNGLLSGSKVISNGKKDALSGGADTDLYFRGVNDVVDPLEPGETAFGI